MSFLAQDFWPDFVPVEKGLNPIRTWLGIPVTFMLLLQPWAYLARLLVSAAYGIPS